MPSPSSADSIKSGINASDQPLHGVPVIPFDINADPSKILQVYVERWVTQLEIRVAHA